MVAGVLLTTRILYPFPIGVIKGIVTLILPLVVVFNDPMEIGVAKLPVASDSWAVKTFPTV